jgi:hypothetical protein
MSNCFNATPCTRCFALQLINIAQGLIGLSDAANFCKPLSPPARIGRADARHLAAFAI